MITKETRNGMDVTEIERCLLGSLMLDPGLIDSAGDILHPGEFLDPANGALFGAIVDLHESGTPVDALTVRQRIRELGIAGDWSTGSIAEMCTGVPHARHGGHYASEVREAARVRSFRILAADIDAMASGNGVKSDSIVSRLQAKLDAFGSNSLKSTPIGDCARELINELERPECRSKAAYIGIYPIDSVLGGMMPGELVIVAARVGCGKTSLGMQLAVHAAMKDRFVLFVSLEMRRIELVARVICGFVDVDSAALRKRNVTPEQLDAIKSTAAELEQMPIDIFDPPAATIRQIRGLAKMAKATGKLDLLVIDYLGLISAVDRSLPRFEQVSQISKSLKELAKELDIPVVALCQLNREADGVEPKLSQLRDSGSIEQDADIVLLLHSEPPQPGDPPDVFSCIIAKHRHGETGKVKLRFNKKQTRFETLNGFP